MDYSIKSLTITSENIHLLEQLNDFHNLQELICTNLKLESLSLEKASKLRKLNCNGNQLTRLDLIQVPDLQELQCRDNKLTQLDLTYLPNLQKIYCSNNQLQKLVLTHMPNLQELYCSYNQLQKIDLTRMPNLQELYCSYNQLQKLDLTQLPNLQELYCSVNQLKKLDITQLPNLKELKCNFNRLKKLDFTYLSELQELYCVDNQLTQLNLTYVPNLQELYCYKNQLKHLDLTHVPNLQRLNIANNQLRQLDLTYVPNLQRLNVANNQLRQLDLTHLNYLETLDVTNNQLTILQISDQVLRQLQNINYANNEINLTREQMNILNMNVMANKITTIVDNRQNVHDAQIAKGVIDAYTNLKKYSPIVDVLSKINEDNRIPDEVKFLINKYSNIRDRHSVLNLNYLEALALVYPHHTEGSISTFNEEVLSSVEHGLDVCLTGKLTRLTNSLNGFITDVDISISLLQWINIQAGKIQDDKEIPNADKLQAFLDKVNKEECTAQGIDLTPWELQFKLKADDKDKPEMK